SDRCVRGHRIFNALDHRRFEVIPLFGKFFDTLGFAQRFTCEPLRVARLSSRCRVAQLRRPRRVRNVALLLAFFSWHVEVSLMVNWSIRTTSRPKRNASKRWRKTLRTVRLPEADWCDAVQLRSAPA